MPVIFILSQLQSAGSAEHDIDNSDVAEESDDPHEKGAVNIEAGDEHAGPQEQLAEVVRAAHETIEPCVDEHVGILLLCRVLLRVREHFDDDARGHEDDSYDREDIGAGTGFHPEQDRRGLTEIEQSAGKPDADFYPNRNIGLGFSLQEFFVCGALKLAVEEIPAEPGTVDDEEQAHDEGGGGDICPQHEEQHDSDPRDRETVTHGEEVDIHDKADGGYNKSGQKNY